ncbi:MAG: sigma 54-interacting transcriptional regulator [Planctomycetes bacterium]|nr:sigma 54-interacting transcriptional regulator [Planctomycetota bacterium]
MVCVWLSVSDATLRSRLRELAERRGFDCAEFDGGASMPAQGGGDGDVLVAEHGAAAADALAHLQTGRGTPAWMIMLVAHGDADAARLEALRRPDGGPLRIVDVRGGLAELDRVLCEIAGGRGGVSPALCFGDFVTASALGRRLVDTARRVAQSRATVLILGETGVGKERLASAIHAEGGRGERPMVVVNCGAIPESLLESELFGHERGAFTGAERVHRGYFELADGGTILLDEIGEMPPPLQVKLLHVLQERSIRRVGGERVVPVDVRVIAATHRDLASDMAEGRFRADLYYRISVVTLTIPPLRERPEDVPILVEAFLHRAARDLHAPVRAVGPAAMRALRRYPWPGNVRELANVVERAVLMCDSDTIELGDLPDAVADVLRQEHAGLMSDHVAEPFARLPDEWFEMPFREARHAWNAAFEKLYLQRLLAETHGRIGHAAERLGMDPRSLYDKLRTYGIRKEDYR